MNHTPSPSFSPAAAPPVPQTLVAALQELLAAERAGARVASQSLHQAQQPQHRALLERIRDGEADSCRRLIACLAHLGIEPGHQVGAFHDKAMAIADMGERLVFVDRGQRWVIRRIAAELPGCADPFVRAELQAVLKVHQDNSLPAAA